MPMIAAFSENKNFILSKKTSEFPVSKNEMAYF
jgi:hypothetical protein